MLNELIEEARRIFDIEYEMSKRPADEEEFYKKINKELNIIMFEEKPNASMDVGDVITACVRALKNQNNKIKQYDQYFKQMKDTIKKIQQIVDIYNNTNGEFATLPNGEEICISDNKPIIEYLQKILEEEEK